nr:enoyl-CoA hydratase/isomerase family protein [Rhabdothermincola salaria]
MHVEQDEGVVTVTIDAPPLNLVDADFMVALLGWLPDAEGDDSVRVVVFRSADPDFFLMHGDVHQLVDVVPDRGAEVTEPNVAQATFERLHRAPFFTIGVLDGVARGGGCEFLSALDLRIGSFGSVVGQPEAALGILPGAGGTVRWSRLVGRSRALELLLTGRDVPAEEALALGWLDALLPAQHLDEHAMALARRVARLPRASIAAVKEVVDAALTDDAEVLAVENAALTRLMATGGHQEPMRRFLAAGGQTREGERGDISALLAATMGDA